MNVDIRGARRVAVGAAALVEQEEPKAIMSELGLVK